MRAWRARWVSEAHCLCKPGPTHRAVTFHEGEAVLVTLPLSGATRTYSLRSLPPGTHEITATYGGNANCEPSEDAISQVKSLF